MRAVRFRDYGEPADVLCLEEADVLVPRAGHICIRVHACGLNPADWALCRGLMAGNLPCGIGLDVSGWVEAIGEGVEGVAIGDRVVGVPAFQDYPSAGAADQAVLNVWTAVPDTLDLTDAAALPMAIETASRCLAALDPAPGSTLLVYGAGTMIGYAAVQMAAMRGARVIAAAGDTFADQLRTFGAEVTRYGDGMVERVRHIVGGAPDLIFDAGPISDILPELVSIVDGDAGRILTVSNHGPEAAALGVRDSFSSPLAYSALPTFAQLAAEGRFEVPVARTFPLERWREALDISLGGQASGKLISLPGVAADLGVVLRAEDKQRSAQNPVSANEGSVEQSDRLRDSMQEAG